jgi:hypothetical protein
MSSALAAAATIRVIASKIDQGVSSAVNASTPLSSLLGANWNTRCQSPDQVPIEGAEEAHLNLFLYSVSMNQGWRNAGAPVRDASGRRIGRPPLGIDLHFMMSAYGPDDYVPEMLLGIGMQVLHETPFLDRGYIQALFSGAAGFTDEALAGSLLDQQVEQIKIMPHDLSADDLYKLWSAFGSKCRPSAAYLATVVLIESTAPTTTGLPVLKRNLGVLPYTQPVIAALSPATFMLPKPPAMQLLTLTGQGLSQPDALAVFNGLTSSPTASGPTAGSIVTAVPPTVTPGSNAVSIVVSTALGPPPAKPVGGSDPVGFVVQPAIAVNGAVAIAGGVTGYQVTLWPPLGSMQNVSLPLDQMDVAPGYQLHYQIDALQSDITTSAAGSVVLFRDPPGGDAVQTGSSYLVRVSVDGTQSVPSFDPIAGFNGPLLAL